MNTYNVVVSVSTTVCIDAKDSNDAIEKVNQQLSHGDAALKAQLRENLETALDECCIEATDAIPTDE
jgi:hypothetical protein